MFCWGGWVVVGVVPGGAVGRVLFVVGGCWFVFVLGLALFGGGSVFRFLSGCLVVVSLILAGAYFGLVVRWVVVWWWFGGWCGLVVFGVGGLGGAVGLVVLVWWVDWWLEWFGGFGLVLGGGIWLCLA